MINGLDYISAGPEHFSICNSNIILLCYHIRISNFLAMTLRTYRFSSNLSDSFESVKGCVSSLADYYPVDVSMFARGSNGVRYPSNTITVHKFNEITLKAALYYPIANAMEEWAIDAAAGGDFSGINTEEVVLDIAERKRPQRLCPCCNKNIKFQFTRHLKACSKGRACTLCLTIPESLLDHELECSGHKFPCRVCHQILHRYVFFCFLLLLFVCIVA